MAVILATLVSAGCGPRTDDHPPARPHEPPSIILVLIDALRRDHVGLYGYPKPTTPFIDALGHNGVIFDDALSQAPETLNSTASLFTSRRFPFLLRGVEHGEIPGVAPERRDQWARTPRLAAANLTVAEVLASAGYETVALFNNPHHHPSSGFDQGFATARLLDRDFDQAYARIDSMTEAFLDWHEDREPDRPYFAYLHLMDPHNPYRPPEAYRELFPPGHGRHLYVNGRPVESFTTTDLETMTALYDAEIRFLDDGLGSLVAELGNRGDFDNTIIVITADHGEELMDHAGLGHGKTVELEQLRIPLVMAGGPVDSADGTRIESLVRNLDLAPTIVDLAGIEVPGDFQGASLMPLIRGTDTTLGPPRISYAWFARLRSLSSSEWHCTSDLQSGVFKLYHRTTDPRGITNVASEHPEVAELCRSELHRLEAEGAEARRRAETLKAIETGGGLPPESDEVLEQLKALGYLD